MKYCIKYYNVHVEKIFLIKVIEGKYFLDG